MDLVPLELEALDARVAALGGDRWLERLHRGTRWAEGPVYVPAGRFLVWSDIPNDRMLRWDELTGAVGPFREPA
ncbi:SMP-30/gluconolactonase/LRE family protein, partial [Nonomuraea sp. SMC257]|nr:SMP-30/gluconolactonase/LRE family protein [Nonomuraea montanisoli]